MNIKGSFKILSILLFSVLPLLIGANTNGAKGVIRGEVISNRSEIAIEYASVAIFELPENKLISGGITDSLGKFAIVDIPYGLYAVQISFIGYSAFKFENISITKEKPSVDLGRIFLAEDENMLGDVEIEGERKSITYQLDKKIISPRKDIAAQGGTAIDLLASVPSVKTNAEGEISIKGSTEFTVLIDGKPTALDAGDALQSIAASSIEKIEIITNPSAKYNPEGMGGIVNIVTKSGSQDGLTGLVSASYGSFGENSENVILEYNKNSFKIYGGFNNNSMPSVGSRRTESEKYRDDSVYFSTIESDSKRKFGGYMLKGGVQFELLKKNVFTLEGNYGLRQYERQFDSREENFMNSLGEKNYNIQNTKFHIANNYSRIIATYSREFSSPNNKLTASFSLMNRQAESTDKFEQFASTSDWIAAQFPYQKTNTLSLSPRTISENQIDYSKQLNKTDKFEAGLYGKNVRISTEYTDSYLDTAINTTEMQISGSGEYSLHRDIYASYLIWSRNAEKFGIQAGLRGEYSVRYIDHSEIAKPEQWDIFNLYPSVHISYNADKKNSFQASYSKKVDRPRTYYLYPVPTTYESTNLRIGNPLLKPENNHSFELNYQRKINTSSFITELYYRYSNDVIARISTLQENNVLLYTFDNVDSESSLGVESVFDWEYSKLWNTFASVNLYRYTLKSQYNEDFNSKLTYNVKLNSSIKLKSKTKLQVTAAYHSEEVDDQGIETGYYIVDIGASQNLLKNMLTINASVSDILQSRGNMETQMGEGFSIKRYDEYKAPIFKISATYRLNNYKNKAKTSRGSGGEGGGDDGE